MSSFDVQQPALEAAYCRRAFDDLARERIDLLDGWIGLRDWGDTGLSQRAEIYAHWIVSNRIALGLTATESLLIFEVAMADGDEFYSSQDVCAEALDLLSAARSVLSSFERTNDRRLLAEIKDAK